MRSDNSQSFFSSFFSEGPKNYLENHLHLPKQSVFTNVMPFLNSDDVSKENANDIIL